MTNELFQSLAQAAAIALVAALGYVAAMWRARAKTAEKDVEREHQEKDIVVQKGELELERTKLELRLQTERAENEKAIREAMMLSMRRVATLEDLQEKQSSELRVTKDQYSEAKGMLDDLQAQLIGRDRDSAKRTEEITRLTRETSDLSRRLTETETSNKSERDKLLKIIEEKDRELERMRQENTSLKETLQQVRQELDEVKERLTTVEHKPAPPLNGTDTPQ